MKDIYEHFNNLKLDDEDFEEMEVNEVEKARVKAKLKQSIQKNKSQLMRSKQSARKKWGYGIGAAVFAFGLLVASATVSPAMATVVSSIPIIGSIFSESGDSGLELVNEQGLSTKVGTTKNVGGTSITLDEVFYDEIRFTIGFSMKSENPIGDYLSSGPNITINGKGFSNASGYKETEISPTHRTGIINIDSIDELPEAFTLGVNFTGEDGKQWNFSTPVNTKSKVQYVAINHTVEDENIDLTVSDLKVSPAGLQFSFNANSEEINSLSKGYLDFKVIDDKGKELISHSGVSESQIIDGKEHLNGTRRFDPISNDVKNITVIPYIIYQLRESSAKIDALGNETITVIKPYEGTDIEFESFTVTLPLGKTN